MAQYYQQKKKKREALHIFPMVQAAKPKTNQIVGKCLGCFHPGTSFLEILAILNNKQAVITVAGMTKVVTEICI